MKRSLAFFAVTFIALSLWATITFIGAFLGWWLKPLAETNDQEAFFREVAQLISESTNGNAAVIAIEDGAAAFKFFTVSKESIDEDTYFPTASFSKFVTAIAILQLVEQGLIDMDAPVSNYLTRWKLPAGNYDTNAVTARRLLSHTAGLTDELGFGDYREDERLPELEDELAKPRASAGRDVRIEVGIEPGLEFRYSGGGYLILELLVEEVTGVSFEAFVDANIFKPLGMAQSNYAYIGSLENVAKSYDREGNAVESYQYASSAATGLNSSALDLALLAQALLPRDGMDTILDQKTIRMMRTPHASTAGIDIWGLGTILYAPTPNGDMVFGHDGANDPAINSSLRINPETRDAIVVLSNGHPSLATTIGFHWVLWQTGYPDPLNSARIMASMWLPLGLGSGLILIVAVVSWRRGFGVGNNG